MRARAADLKRGQEFRTLLTGREGTVLEIGRQGVEVVLEADRIGEVVKLHPAVEVEVES